MGHPSGNVEEDPAVPVDVRICGGMTLCSTNVHRQIHLLFAGNPTSTKRNVGTKRASHKGAIGNAIGLLVGGEHRVGQRNTEMCRVAQT